MPEIDSPSIQFKLPRFVIYRVICDMLEGDNCVMEAIDCFRQMQSELLEDTSLQDERVQWERGRWLQRDVGKADSNTSLRFPRTLCREAGEAG
jgi:hypothetical protein